ncbi:MAG: hypothetical protein RL553_2113 [Planctomycetota bacterium]
MNFLLNQLFAYVAQNNKHKSKQNCSYEKTAVNAKTPGKGTRGFAIDITMRRRRTYFLSLARSGLSARTAAPARHISLSAISLSSTSRFLR